MNDRISFGEALDNYDNNINVAIANILGIDEVEASRIIKEIPLDEFLNLTMSMENNDEKRVRRVMMKYAKKQPSVEGITLDIKNRIAEGKSFIIPVDMQTMTSADKRSVLEGMRNAELQRIMANLRGFTSGGLYEGELFDAVMIDEILKMFEDSKLADIEEAIGGRPGEQQSGTAYGNEEPEAPSPANSPENTTPNGKKSASFTNDAGELEQGEVMGQDAQSVTIKTKKGAKKIDIEQAMVDETVEALKSNIIKLSNFGRDK